MKKICIGLAVVLLFFSTGCSWIVPVELSDEDLVAILKILAKETESHRLTEKAEEGRLIVFDVSSFETERIGEFLRWAKEEYDRPPNAFVIRTGGEEAASLANSEAAHALGSLYTADALAEWTNYSFAMLEYSGRGKQSCTFEVGVFFPMADLVGAGNAYRLEKNDGTWEIVDHSLTWIA